ncbi:MAG: hypothetical protein KIT63_02585 [Rhodoferax sp.]|nr:hypothetical protein [Rhodoferax sp.]
MLAANALAALTRDLAAALGGMGLKSGDFGLPSLVEKPTKDAEKLFQGYAKAGPSKEDAYAAARAFLRGVVLDSWQRDLVASAVSEPIREQSGAMVLGHKRFASLLKSYEEEANRGDLWRLTWHGLLFSYFNFDPTSTTDESSHKGWAELRAFLERTWPLIDRQAGTKLVPDWVGVLRKESDLLTTNPAEKYARDYLRGDTDATDQLKADLGIPPSSWFWHALVLGAVKKATGDSDNEFVRLIPQLIRLIQSKPGFRDEALEHILNRYHSCQGAPQDERLRDFVCHPTVWKNPKLKAAGIATAWNRVPESVWHMVLSWVNERNLKDFFDILAARNKADEGRLEFWSRYLKQISWTRLVFGADTMALKRTNPSIRDLIAREEGAYAQLTGKREVDAFMMQVGSYLIIEFSKKPNACYVYTADELPFEPYAKYYDGGTDDLAAGFRQECAARIVHRDGWEIRAAEELKALGIRPDKPLVRRVATAPPSETLASGARTTNDLDIKQASGRIGSPDMAVVRALVGRFQGASIDDRRSSDGGRLWVKDSKQRVQLGNELRSLGFKWAPKRTAWYYPENSWGS